MALAVGMDLGTTFSAVAAVRQGGRPEVLWNRDGEHVTPSVVLYQDGDQVLVGALAKRSIADLPDDCAQFVKRHMGDPNWVFVDSRGVSRRPEEISAVILKRLAEDAAMALGEPVTDVVITVPAYFDDARRKATLDAGEIAGLNVLRLINEPTAAGIAYGVTESDSGTYFVYDLGGGTFDVTVMRVRGGDLEVMATDGDRNLGGFDFDNELIRHVAGAVAGEGGPDLLDGGRLEAELRERCEQAKKSLTSTMRTRLFFSGQGRTHQVEVTRERFEELTAHLLDRTEVLAQSVLTEAGLSWSGIDRVLLVGGSTRMPMVRQMINRISGQEPQASINPDEAVALGAAIVAEASAARESGRRPGLPVPVNISDVTSQSLGVVAVRDDERTEYNSVIIPKNSKIPCKLAEHYQTIAERQRRLLLQVTEGDDEDLAYVTKLLERPIDLPAGLPKGAPIRVVMAYDVDGVVHVEVVDETSGRSLGEVELDRPLNLDGEQVAQLRRTVREVEVQ